MKLSLKEKCIQQRGSTILMALVLVLVATLATAGVLKVVAAEAQTLRRDRQRQQTELLVTSGAKLLSCALRDTRVTAEVLVTDTGLPVQTRQPQVRAGVLEDFWAEAVRRVFGGEAYTKIFAIEPGADLTEKLSAVTVELTVASDFAVLAVLTCGDCRIFLRAAVEISEEWETQADGLMLRRRIYTWREVRLDD